MGPARGVFLEPLSTMLKFQIAVHIINILHSSNEAKFN